MQVRVLGNRLSCLVRAVPLLVAATLGIGCGAEGEPSSAADLRQRFPAQADEVLSARFAFAVSQEGFEIAPAALAAPHIRGLRAQLPARGDGAVRFELPGGSEVRVREVTAAGEGSLSENAVAYARRGGASFWAATEAGYEEWLSLEPWAVHRDAPVAVWEIEGAALSQRGEAVLVVDESGLPQIRVTAPAAYAAGGRPIETRLRAEGATIELWVNADSEAVLVDPGWVRVKGSMTTPRDFHTATLLQDGRVLVTGGYTDALTGRFTAELFDPASKTWTPVAPMIAARVYHSATLLKDGRVLVTGGYDEHFKPSNRAELFDPATYAWESAGSMISGRGKHSATLLEDGRVLVAGGDGDNLNKETIADAEVFDPASKKWMPASPMSVARSGHTATLLQSGQVLVTGGTTGPIGGDLTLADAEVFDPATGIWTLVSPMSAARSDHTATLLTNGQVLVAGAGECDAGSSGAELFDPVNNVWTTPVTPMSTPRRGHTATRMQDGRVLVAGGSSCESECIAGAEVFDPAENTWRASPWMSEPRRAHTATLLADGRVLAAGGFCDEGHVRLARAEVFDPTAPAWTAVPSMSAPRYGHTATSLPDGRILIAGSSKADVELWNPATESFTPGPPMSTARIHHTATLLKDGRVLVTGGKTDDTTTSSSAEVFDPASDTWKLVPPMSVARSAHTATLLEDHRVLIAGGDGPTYLSSAEVFDPATESWETVAEMSRGRAWHTATLFSHGEVIVAGGDDSSAEVFNGHIWTSIPPMSAAHSGHTATRLDEYISNEILIAGGGADEAAASAEIFDYSYPSNGSTGIPPMSAARRDHTATLLRSGHALIAGGRSDTINAISSAELFDSSSRKWFEAPSMTTSRAFHEATRLSDGRVLVTGGVTDSLMNATASAEVFSAQPLGTGCSEDRECQSGYCADGVCCDLPCDSGLCKACSEARGASADGTCTDLHPECSPFTCIAATGACRSSCEDIFDCAEGYACTPDGDCILPPPSYGYLDKLGCDLASPDRRGATAETSLLFLLAMAALRRKATRRDHRHGNRASAGSRAR